jgi:hypothetical protein
MDARLWKASTVFWLLWLMSATVSAQTPSAPCLTCVSFGAATRLRYERILNVDWGRGPVDQDGYLMQRYLVDADARVGRVRVFGQLSRHEVAGRNGGSRPTDADALDAQQAYVELVGGAATPTRVRVRGGRQEIGLGSERIVSLRDGTNARLAFDGVRAIIDVRGWTATAFGVIPVQIRTGVFDNRTPTSQRFWGAYATRSIASSVGLDLYYLALDKSQARFEQGVAREYRHSIGVRAFGLGRGIDYDLEYLLQWGSFGSATIEAWTAASHVGYTFKSLRPLPRLGLKADITSGDRDPTDARLQTFNPLFPRGGYFGAASLIGPLNHIDLHPSIDVRLGKRVTLSGDWDLFWRESLRDGQYAISGGLQVAAASNRERHVGDQISFTTTFKVNRDLSLFGNYGHFMTGPFLLQSGLSRSMDFTTIWLDYRR